MLNSNGIFTSEHIFENKNILAKQSYLRNNNLAAKVNLVTNIFVHNINKAKYIYSMHI